MGSQAHAKNIFQLKPGKGNTIMSEKQPPVPNAAENPHEWLANLAGRWEGITRTWFEPGVLSDESPCKGTIQPAGKGRFALFEYDGFLDEQPLEGLLLIGFNTLAQRFECAWMDTFHMDNGIMFSTGQAHPEKFSVLGHYDVPNNPPWGWRTEITIQDSDHLTIRMYNISPGGEEALGVETQFSRTSS